MNKERKANVGRLVLTALTVLMASLVLKALLDRKARKDRQAPLPLGYPAKSGPRVIRDRLVPRGYQASPDRKARKATSDYWDRWVPPDNQASPVQRDQLARKAYLDRHAQQDSTSRRSACTNGSL